MRRSARILKVGVQKEIKVNKRKITDTIDPVIVAATTTKKIKTNNTQLLKEAFPSFTKPTKEECKEVFSLLSSVHKAPERVDTEKFSEYMIVEDGVPNVLQAVVRVILSQSTTEANGSRAYQSMEKKFGRMNWEAIHAAPLESLIEALSCGGLAKVKGGYIHGLIKDVFAKHGKYSLNHIYDKSDDEAYNELIQYKGVGPKTAACILLFCLKRETFAVDTHIYRITKLLNWLPSSATREQAFLHLNARLPADLKFPLHYLFIIHGRTCKNCAANGKTQDKENEILAKDCPIKKLMIKQTKKTNKKKKKEKVEEEEEEEKEEEEEEDEKM